MGKILHTAGDACELNLVNFVRAGAVKFFRLAQGEKPDKILCCGEQGLNLRVRVKFRQTAF
jgi:hypothetical protein